MWAGCLLKSVEDDGALVKLVAGVEHLAGDDGGIREGGGLTAHLLAGHQDVLPVGPGGERAAMGMRNINIYNNLEHFIIGNKNTRSTGYSLM